MHNNAANVTEIPITHRTVIRSPKQTADISMDKTREAPCISGYSRDDGKYPAAAVEQKEWRNRHPDMITT